MTLEADSLAERRRMKRRLRFWRGGAILLAFVAVLGFLASREDGLMAQLGLTPHVARVTISGFIADNRERRDLLERLGNSEDVQGVIVYIDSPGGTTAGAETLYISLRRLAEKKPVVAVFGTAATSAAYLAGIAADHIVARGNSITGSVGVILQWAEFSDLLNKLGVNVQEVRSGRLKAVPSPFSPPDPAGQQLIEELVNESRDWFVGLVAQRRELKPAVLEEVRTGRIYTGRQALTLGLIDTIGGEESALQWLQEKHGVSPNVQIIDQDVESSTRYILLHSLARAAAGLFGGAFEGLVRMITGEHQFNRLDGLISLWQPQKQQ